MKPKIKIEHEHRVVMVPHPNLSGDALFTWCDGAGAALAAVVAQNATTEWRRIEPFPETIDGAERFGYVRPTTAEEFDAEMPIDFPDYPTLGEVQVGESLARTTCDFFKHRFAVSQWVETRSRDGLIMSARWEWRARSGAPYRWVVGPRADRMPMERRDVDFWCPIDEVSE